jgi:tRNA U34 5-methylaminomethyl-2-thiouridine-forming methyltransferase MnmC
MVNSKNQILTTADGSLTLFNPEIQEAYHSRHGAITESDHVFIKEGLIQASMLFPNQSLNIIEVGMGTGLNAYLTFHHASTEDIKIQYIGIEPFPPTSELLRSFYENQFFNSNLNANTLYSKPGIWHSISEAFRLKWLNHSALNVSPEYSAHVIYMDAFSPDKAAALWTPDALKKYFNWLLPGGRLVTYCSRGQFRRDLIQTGFIAEKKPGPPGKREMMVATRPLSSGEGL